MIDKKTTSTLGAHIISAPLTYIGKANPQKAHLVRPHSHEPQIALLTVIPASLNLNLNIVEFKKCRSELNTKKSIDSTFIGFNLLVYKGRGFNLLVYKWNA